MKIEKRIESIILEIKKAEKEVNSKKINLYQKKKLIKRLTEINKVGSNYEMIYNYFEPSGANGKTFEKEFNLFLDARDKESKNKKNKYCPVFTYPKLKKISVKKIERDIKKLENIEGKARKGKNEDVEIVVCKVVENYIAKINILIELKKGNLEKAFDNVKIAYGDIDEELVKNAEKCYKEKIKFLSRFRRKYNKKIKENKFLEKIYLNDKEIKEYFEIALEKAKLEKGNIKVIITKDVRAIDVRYNDFKYKHPVVLVPKGRRVCVLKIYELITHEIGAHAISNFYNDKLGLKGLSIGKNWETVHEGIALLNEVELRKKILGVPEFKIKALPFFILSMDKAKRGCNFAEIYDYIYNLKYKEERARGNNIKISKKEAIFRAKSTCRRIFRGFNPKNNGKIGMYFSKDLSYFKGEIEAKKMKEASVDKYIYMSKVDPELIPNLLRLGIYKNCSIYEKEINETKNVAIQIWEEQKNKYIKS
ncbi:DUF1704 domain-containing protein [Patescibacteria group bacterium]|nr:DUF1704 domain-containing protein [Patescibacteria group bacterium]